MGLSERVRIARRFLRSVRIESDITEPSALEGYICPQSCNEVLMTMARHVSESGQGAFTWTGPFGSGKSSLAIALSAFLSSDKVVRKKAEELFGVQLTKGLRDAFPIGVSGWQVLPVIGRRQEPIGVIGEALKRNSLVSRIPRGGWNEHNLATTLINAARAKSQSHDGIILFIDEMGKFLEAAAMHGSDIFLFQELAEAASRSDGRLIIVGILHQAFEEYVPRHSHQMRDEWAKIQGRFLDLVVNTAGEEQIDLISRAIESDRSLEKPSKAATTIADLARRGKSVDQTRLASKLEGCWPLSPVVASLLGPISRRRFGQNQRSIFGFLNSSEPHAFIDFLRHADGEELYCPYRLWDYLRVNLEPSILASPDGHRWALAAEAVERCESIGSGEIHLKLLKTIAIIDLFKERSGLDASFEILCICFPGTSEKTIKNVLADLDKWSFTIFKKFRGAHAIYAGSDFDLDKALRKSLDNIHDVDFKIINALAGSQPVLAKRHYHDTGVMRWFDVQIVPVNTIIKHANNYKPKSGAIGQFLLAIPTEGESQDLSHQLCCDAANISDTSEQHWDIVVGISNRSWTIIPLAREMVALDNVASHHPELAGDSVARREVSARLAELQSFLEMELLAVSDTALWFRKHCPARFLKQSDLNLVASELAESRYPQSPRIPNELLNRRKPSSNAIAAQNILLRAMVLQEGECRLGIMGYPAEGGLFASILETTGLYAELDGKWRFRYPSEEMGDKARLAPMWDAALDHIKNYKDKTVSLSELYRVWRGSPFGVKDGLMPILMTAFIISQRDKLAVYREGIFRAKFDDVDVDYLAKNAGLVSLRWMDLGNFSRRLLSGMAEIVRALDPRNDLVHLEPIDVARGLVTIYDQLPTWTRRTMRLSANAMQIRQLFKKARDPNKFLFDDLPKILENTDPSANEMDLISLVTSVREGLEEMVNAYPAMLSRLRDLMLSELQVPNLSPQSIAELRGRATNISRLAGDFRLESFVGRLSQFDGTYSRFEGIASLAANKPPRDWVDPDLDQASIELADLAQTFLRAETFARVKGRPEKRQAIAVVIGGARGPVPLLEEFHIGDSDRAEVENLIEQMTKTLMESECNRRTIILAALAELSIRYMKKSELEQVN